MIQEILCGGAWTKEIGLSDRMTWFGSELNEYGFDSNADQKAIKRWTFVVFNKIEIYDSIFRK